MRLIKCIRKKWIRFLRHLAKEYVHPCFYDTEAHEVHRKKEQTYGEAGRVIKCINYLNTR